jgi:hypothetical protein
MPPINTFAQLIRALASEYGGAASPVGGFGNGSFAPEPSGDFFSPGRGNIGPFLLDSLGQMMTRGSVLTDEQSFRDDFPGSSLNAALTGSLTFVNGSTTVTGVGTQFLSELTTALHVFLDADGAAFATRIARVISDTELELEFGYAGAGGSGASSKTFWQQIVGAGGSISVVNSMLTIVSGTTLGSQTFVRRRADFLPMLFDFMLAISARVPNQDWLVTLSDDGSLVGNAEWARWRFGGSQTTAQAFCESSGHAGTGGQEGVGTNRTITNSGAQNQYQFALDQESCIFRESGAALPPTTVRATTSRHTPGPYTPLNICIGVNNFGTPGASSTLSFDVGVLVNMNRVRVSTVF